MARVFYDADADPLVLNGRVIGVLGYGNQGRAQALNMRDSGVNVIVGNRSDDFAKQARKDGFDVLSIEAVARKADVICLLLPDEMQPDVFAKDVRPHLSKGKTLDFASGFNIFYRSIVPPKEVDVILVAPKMIGEYVRKLYLAGSGAPSLIAVERNSTGKGWETATALAHAIGATRVGALKSTFEEEAVTDLFNEQCTAFIPLLVAGYEILTAAGYDPMATQLELYGSGEWLEIIRAIREHGIFGQGKLHSTTSQYGQLTRSQKIVDAGTRLKMKKILKDIQNGRFAEEWFQEMKRGYPTLNALKKKYATHSLNRTEAEVRRKIKMPDLA